MIISELKYLEEVFENSAIVSGTSTSLNDSIEDLTDQIFKTVQSIFKEAANTAKGSAKNTVLASTSVNYSPTGKITSAVASVSINL